MAYYLSNERSQDVVGSYQRYQEYLRAHQHEFPSGAFALATAEWYQDPGDHRCPHDGWLESFTISETADIDGKRVLNIHTRLLGAYHDGYIEFFYPRIFTYTLDNLSCASGSGDWLCDEFRLSPDGHLIHEIEWAGLPNCKGSRWIIETSDVEFRWIPK
jgi:hypothetical protein